ncbi:ABC transporter ATP-binding protein [Inquilinus sp. Marseille-Q2685]|uniref:ABC transporter ATP-binding protein n=1 Tax=Inquilinus sp. Marseille-Q2685 TaxID=2866581 RepID=UPI001CE476E0|nr:ABC transporter ATP-binding protein [Inquilinus sp. Marseille-Q2685]
MSADPLLAVENLAIRFRTRRGEAVAVDGVDFTVRRGEVLGIVGESGSGKSQILLSIMGLLAGNGTATGRIRFEGQDLLALDRRGLDRLRGSAMTMIFQDPMTSLNPYHRVGTQLTEVLIRHQGLKKKDAWETAARMLDRVKIPDAERRMRQYPHQLSGGMRQRVMIAMALLCNPRILLADEPTTALDVTVQAQVLDLLRGLVRELGTAVILVTHDLGVVAEMCDRVLVLYGGKVMEAAPVEPLFADPAHPYTRGLLDSTPDLEGREGELRVIPGQPRAAAGDLPGCPFAPRCERRVEACTAQMPPLLPARDGSGRVVACHRPLPQQAAVPELVP